MQNITCLTPLPGNTFVTLVRCFLPWVPAAAQQSARGGLWQLSDTPPRSSVAPWPWRPVSLRQWRDTAIRASFSKTPVA